jgi:hypothetical protein
LLVAEEPWLAPVARAVHTADGACYAFITAAEPTANRPSQRHTAAQARLQLIPRQGYGRLQLAPRQGHTKQLNSFLPILHQPTRLLKGSMTMSCCSRGRGHVVLSYVSSRFPGWF